MFNAFQISSVFSFLATMLVGLVVFTVNPTRRANRHFLTVSGVLGVWFLCMIFGSFATSRGAQLFWIRQSHFWSLALPLAFDLLRLSIAHAEESWKYYRAKLRPFLLMLLFAGVLAQSDFFVSGIRLTENGFPQPVFGRGQVLYLAAWLVALAFLVSNYTRDLYSAKSVARTELQFVLLAALAAVTTGLSLGHFIPLATGNRNITQLLPLCILPLDGVLAYGIATRRIMSVSEILRRTSAYALMAAYLALLYFAVHTVLTAVLTSFVPAMEPLVNLAAAMVVAFSLAPSHGWMQRFANKIFINLTTVDFQSTVQQARQAMMSIGTTDELLRRFAEIARNATGTDRIQILLADDGHFVQPYPPAGEEECIVLAADDPLINLLLSTKAPVCADTERRQRPTQIRIATVNELDRLRAALAVGVQTKGKLSAVVLLGRRLSGKLYSAHEQDALQLFCEQIGVAIENAELYTEVQNTLLTHNPVLA